LQWSDFHPAQCSGISSVCGCFVRSYLTVHVNTVTGEILELDVKLLYHLQLLVSSGRAEDVLLHERRVLAHVFKLLSHHSCGGTVESPKFQIRIKQTCYSTTSVGGELFLM
jgi:hypothetical protein